MEKKKKTEKEEVVYKEGDRHLRLVYLYQILLKYTDAEHPLTTPEIRKLMMEKYGIFMHRTTVTTDIELLQSAGYEIISRRSRMKQYYVDANVFELPELKILIDAVESSKFITEKKSRALVQKLISMASEANAKKLKRHLHTSGRVRSDNEKGYYIVDAVNEAINAGRQISFYYADYDGRKKRILRNDGRPYTVSPFMLIWNGDFYYLVGWYHEKERISVFRVDRIESQPEILDVKAKRPPRGFSAARYSKEVFRMYDAEELQEVTLICEDSVMKGVLDQFGLKQKTWRVDENHFGTKVTVCASPTFFAWVFQWEGRVKIEEPGEAAEAYRKMLQGAEV